MITSKAKLWVGQPDTRLMDLEIDFVIDLKIERARSIFEYDIDNRKNDIDIRKTYIDIRVLRID